MEFKTVEELKNEANKFSDINTDYLVQTFKDNHIYFPDFVYRFLLLNCFKKHIFDDAYMQLYSDEFKYKLRSYNFFSIHLLRKTVEEYNIDVKPYEFKNIFVRFFLKNEKKFKKSIILNKTLEEAPKDEDSKETIKECLEKFDPLFYTPKGYLDGISLSIIKESIIATYSMPYLKDIGLKYGVDIPKRINKAQLIDLVSARLQLTPEERAEIENKSITEIITYSKKKGFKVSSDLKKSDMVEYIIFNLNKYNEDVEKDLYNYDVLTQEDELTVTVEQDNLEQTDQAIPTSANLVDPDTEDLPNESAEEEAQEEPQEVEPAQEAEVIEEVTQEEENPSTKEVQEEPQEITEEPQEEPAQEEEPQKEDDEPKVIKENIEEEDLSQPDIYYDQTVDEEIKDIIKKYYAKKLRKDTWLRIAMIAIFIVVAGLLLYFAFKYYNIF